MSTGNLAGPDEKPMDHWRKDQAKRRPDLDDMLSLSSASPGPSEDVPANCEPPKLPDKAGTLIHLHRASPLESITELAEVDEGNEYRLPGDGAVRFKDAEDETASRDPPLTTDSMDPMVDDASNLPNQLLDACTSEHERPLGYSEGASNVAGQRVKCGSFARIADKMPSHQLTTSYTSSGILEVPQSPVASLQDDKEEPEGSQSDGVIPNLMDGSESADEPDAEDVIEDNSGKEDGGPPEEANQSLIQILTACEDKVEQLEKLKSSSFQLSNQLHSARALAARLHQRVLYLEHEGQQKERELRRLTVRMEEMSKALQARDGEMSAVREELQRLRLESAPKTVDDADRTVAGVNGRVVPHSHLYDDSSKVCTLL